MTHGHIITSPDKPSMDKPSMDKLIDINHYLVGRVQELEEIVETYMQRQVQENLERMKEREAADEC